MAESKNNFIKAKMNQDLDDRLIPQGEYRVGQNVTISRSEGDGVGTFQNILGNNDLSSFGLTDTNLKIIGYLVEEVNNALYVFITNYTDSSIDQLSNRAPVASSNYIVRYDFTTNSSNILVQGSFLNFSKTHRIYGVNLIENLLFWTDNRNQPRKINISIASTNSSYYDSEDKVSVAKFYPSVPLQFYKEIKLQATNSQSGPGGTSLSLNVRSSAIEEGLYVGMPVSLTPQGGTIGQDIYIQSISSVNPDTITLSSNSTWSSGDVITFSQYGLKNCSDPYLPVIFECTLSGGTPANGTYIIQNSNGAAPVLDGYNSVYADSEIYIANSGTSEPTMKVDEGYKVVAYNNSTRQITIQNSSGGVPESTPGIPINLDDSTVVFYRSNPDYDVNFSGDSEFLKDKFVRFSYRYKFDDNEYSLMAPFTQIAFTPKNFGSFVLNEEELAAKSSVVNFFENNIDCIDLYIRTPFQANNTTPVSYSSWSTAFNSLNIKEVEILCKFADETTVKVVDVLDQTFVNNLSDSGNDYYIKYNYKSTKPIRVLPEKDITRVYDKAPIRALAQEVSGNRVMYGNYLDKHTSPLNIDYKLAIARKPDIPLSQDKRLFNNHTLKENRTYQVGIVLSDRYGRQSDVVLSSIQDSFDDAAFGSFGASTIYNPYSTANDFSASDILNFTGKQMLLFLETAIPETISQPGYPGLYSAENPLGWYTYKIVVKQQEQEYYNVYTPSAYRSDAADYNFLNSYFSLVNDNINKVPKDLSNVGPEEKEFRSSVRLFPKVNPITNSPNSLSDTTSYFISPLRRSDEVSSIIYNAVSDINIANGSLSTKGLEVEPTKLYKGKVATIANVINNKLFGVTDANTTDATWSTLGVYETNPFVSNLDIYYETSTSGFISELNSSINTGTLGPVSLNQTETLSFRENTEPYFQGTGTVSSPQEGVVIYTVELLDVDGISLLSPNNTCSLDSVFSSVNPSTNIVNDFILVPQQAGSPLANTGRFNVYAKRYFYVDQGQNFTFNITATANNETNNTLSFSGQLSNVQPQFNQQGNPGGVQLGEAYIPIEVEPYRDYQRVTGTGESLRPYYYEAPNNGDNKADQGIGQYGELPVAYYYDSQVPASGLGFSNDAKALDNLKTYFTGQASQRQFSIDNWSFGSNNGGEYGSGQSSSNYCSYLMYGGLNDYAVVDDGGTPAPIYTTKFSAVFWWKSLMYDNGIYPNTSGQGGWSNYPFQDIAGIKVSSGSLFLRNEITPPTDQMELGKLHPFVKYDSQTSQPGPWNIFELQDISRFIDNGVNGGTGFLNGTLDTSRWQDDLTYSLSDFHFPKGDILADPLNPTSRFSDSTGEIATIISNHVSISVDGVISIIGGPNGLLSYFGINGSKTSLIPDANGDDFGGGIILNNELGHGNLNLNRPVDPQDPYNPAGPDQFIGSYGMFWIGFDLNVTDSFGTTTTKPINLLTIA